MTVISKDKNKLVIPKSAPSNTSSAPVWKTVPSITWETGETVSVDLTDYVISPDGSPLTFAQPSGSLPGGLTLSTAGVISGTISDVQGGTYEPVVSATNSSGTTTQVLPTITVTLPFSAPTWKTSPDNVPDFNLQQVGEAFSLDLNDYILDDGDPTKVSTLTYTYTSDNGFPAGLTFGSNGVITGITTTTQTITVITITVTNEEEFDSSESFQITVSAIAATSETPEIFGWYSGELSCAVSGVAPTWGAADNFFVSEDQTGVSIDMLGLYLASEGTSAVTEVLIASGSLPTGLSLQTVAGGAGIGFITGTVGTGTAGDYNFTLTAEGDGVSDPSPSFSMTVTDTSLVIPTLDSIDAVKDSNIVHFNFSEAVGTTTDFTTGVVIRVNSVQRNITAVANTGTNRFAYTIDGAALAEFNTISAFYADTAGGLGAPPSTAARQVASASVSFAIPVTPVGVIFSDDFETGDLSKSEGGFRWRPGAGTSVSSDNSFTGTYSLRFFFNGTGTTFNGSSAEQGFFIGSDHNEIWVSYYIYLPDGTETYGGSAYERTTTAESGFTSLNHKVNRFWDNDFGYSSNPEKMGVSSWPWRTIAQASIEYSETDGGGLLNHYDGTIFTSGNLGNWIKYVFNAKIETALGAGNGHFKIWRDGTLLASDTGLTNFASDRAHYFNTGYLFGAANKGFKNDTIIFVDDFVISTASLL